MVGVLKGKAVLFFIVLVTLCMVAFGQMTALDWSNKGADLFGQGKYNEALQAFNKATEIDPQLAGAWTGKGYTLKNLGRYDEALQAFDKAIEINPLDANARDDKDKVLKTLRASETATPKDSVDAAVKGIISGRIINAESKMPVSKADIAIRDANDYVFTGGIADASGFFNSPQIFSPSSKYMVICDTFGYIPNSVDVITDSHGNATADLAISQEFEVNSNSCSKYGGNWQNGECNFIHNSAQSRIPVMK